MSTPGIIVEGALVPLSHITPDMKYYPFAVPVLILRSTVKLDTHFNQIHFSRDYKYKKNLQDNELKFTKSLMAKLGRQYTICDKTLIDYSPNLLAADTIHVQVGGKVKMISYRRSEKGVYIDESMLRNVNFPSPRTDYSSIDDFIESNACRIRDGTNILISYLRDNHFIP